MQYDKFAILTGRKACACVKYDTWNGYDTMKLHKFKIYLNDNIASSKFVLNEK